MKKSIVLDAICFFLIVLFVYTAFSKLLNYSDFVFILNQTRELKPFTPILSISLPFLEITAAFFLMIPLYRTWGLYLSCVLMGAFTLYVAYLLLLASHRPCACGGIMRGLSWKQHLVFNSLCTAISIVGILINGNRRERTELKEITFI
jgi:putative oxidoreductase